MLRPLLYDRLDADGRLRLRRMLIDYFNHDELNSLCADYFPHFYQDVQGLALLHSQRVDELIRYCETNGVLANLRAAIAIMRPALTPMLAQRSLLERDLPQPRPLKYDPRRVFISHAFEDADLAQRLARDLRRRGLPVWIAPGDIPPGQSWMNALDAGLRASGHYVILLSPQATQSRWVAHESSLALQLEAERRLSIIPMQVRACDLTGVFAYLRHFQWIKLLHARRYAHAVEELATRLGAVLPTGVAHAPQITEIRINPKRLRAVIQLEAPVSLTLMRVRRGYFWMGSHPERDRLAYDNELPRHRVFLPDYYISRTPVTVEAFARFARATHLNWQMPAGPGDAPATGVTWHEASAFCDWLEWEKAARGTDGRVYPWGNAYRRQYCNGAERNVGGLLPVGSHSPAGDSPYGVADMAGNTWEWCSNWFDENSYADRSRDLRGPAQGTRKALRGGAFGYERSALRCAYRVGNPPHSRMHDVGFRVVGHIGR
jgi:formylglycine-generating enzyme required for sulfatase activity